MTERHTDDVAASELAEGDRISKMLVARTPGQLGDKRDQQRDCPAMQLLTVTEIRRHDDVHSALLLDPVEETFIRASRHAKNQAWSQAEADWKAREIGTKIEITKIHGLERPEDESDGTDRRYIEEWVDILFGDIRKGHYDYNDRRKLDGRALELDDVDGRKALFDIELSDE